MSGRQEIPRPLDWEPAPPREWRAELGLTALASAPPVVPIGSQADLLRSSDPQARLSAVLVAFTDSLPRRSGVHVLVTRRPTYMRTHAGQVAFPGGGIEGAETPQAAAVREAYEEVGMPPGAVRLRGELPHVRTYVNNHHIIPVVGTVPDPPPLRPDPVEVDAAYWVAVEQLLAPGVHHRETWTRGGYRATIDFFELDDDIVWGATARMLVSLLALPDD